MPNRLKEFLMIIIFSNLNCVASKKLYLTTPHAVIVMWSMGFFVLHNKPSTSLMTIYVTLLIIGSIHTEFTQSQ